MKYRFNGKEKTLSFGMYPDVTLRQASLLHAEARQLLAQRIDPRAVEKERKAQEKAQALTFKTVAERWYRGRAELAKKPWAVSTAKKVRLYLEKDIYPLLAHRPIADITRRQLVDLNESIEK